MGKLYSTRSVTHDVTPHPTSLILTFPYTRFPTSEISLSLRKGANTLPDSSRVESNPVQSDSRVNGGAHRSSRVQSILREFRWVLVILEQWTIKEH